MIAPAAILLRPVLPIALVVALVVTAAAFAWHTYRFCALGVRQRVGLWSFRMAAMLIISWLLMQAERREESYKIEQPVLALAVDVSASMTEKLAQAKERRSERAMDFLQDRKLARLADDYRLARYEIGLDLEESTGEMDDIVFNAPRSHIASGINEILDKLRAENLAGIILLSDGLDHSGEALAPQAQSIPIFMPELEEPIELEAAPIPDCWVAEISYPKMMVVNWKASVDVLVRRDGTGKSVFPIHFRQGSRILRTSMIQLEDEEQFRQVSFSVEPLEVGQILYQVEIAPKQDGNPKNNTKEFLIEVTDPKNRVLYLEGSPRWEFKFLKRALLSEKNYQLSAFVRGGDGSFINFSEVAGMTGGDVPTLTAEALREYKVLVLGDLPSTALTEENLRSVRDFVDKGGGLLLIGAAQAYGPAGLHKAPYLEELLPATSKESAKMLEGRFSVDMTPTGRAHSALSSLPHEMRLPPILSFWSPVQVSPFSSVLIATADNSPVLAVRRYGQGRVAMVLSDSLWRWQLGGMDDAVEKSLYNRFVTQLIYWLAPSEKDVEKTALLQVITAKSEYEMREKVTIGAFYEQPPDEKGTLTAKITTPDGRRLAFPMVSSLLGSDVGISRAMNGFKCEFTPQAPGKFQVAVSTPDGTQEQSLLLLVKRAEHERTGAPINRRFLQQLAETSGGQLLQWEDRFDLAKAIKAKPKKIEIVDEYPIWNRWWWLVLLVTLFSLEWYWRRTLDLV